jgi:plastocyanin
VRTRPRARSLLAALFAAALGLGFVGGASGWAGGTATRRPITIRVGDFFYKPKLATVHVGQAVRFVNVGKIPHTVADTDARGAVRSRLIKPHPLEHGQVQVVRFSKPGRISYLCTFHPTLMKGRIVVVR